MSAHLFYGANSYKGFYSVFDNILFPEEAKKRIFIKGSSGGGKSTLMRKIAGEFEKNNISVDYIHCSNDINDLDAISAPLLGVCIIDATAPHVCEPLIPTALDEIFNTADFIDEEKIIPYTDELLSLHKEKKPFYEKAYNYLNSAYTILKNNELIYRQNRNNQELKRLIENELSIFKERDTSLKQGIDRKIFASAITPQGNVNYIGTLIGGYKFKALKGENGMGIDVLLHEIRREANARGIYTQTCLCALDYEKIDYLIIPQLKICFGIVNEDHKYYGDFDREIDFSSICNMENISAYEEEINYNKKTAKELITKAMNTMAAQKNIHDKIEKIFVSSMDFEKLNEATQALKQRLCKYIEN